MLYKAAHVIGPNTDQTAAQALSTKKDESNIFAAVIHLTCDDAFTRGRQLLSELTDFYFEEEGSIPDKINNTFAKAEQLLTNPTVEEGVDEALPLPPAAQYDLVLAVISGKTLYILYTGNVVAYLKREGKISSLLSIGSPKQIISGFLQDQDRMLLATSDLSDYLESELEKTLDLSLEEWEDEVTTKISTGNLDHHGMAGLLIEAIPEVIKTDEISAIEKEASPKAPTIEFKNPFTGVLAAIGKKMRERQERQQDTYLLDNRKRFNVSRFFPSSGRSRLVLAVLLLLIIGIGVSLKVKNDLDAQKTSDFNTFLQQARDDFSAAQGLQNLNPSQAREKIDSARVNLDKALNIKPGDTQGEELKNKINEQEGVILQQFSAQNFPEFLDLNLIKKDFRANRMSLEGGKLLILDQNTDTLVLIDVVKKSNQVLAGKEKLGDGQFASLNSGAGFVFSQDKGVVKLDINNQKDSVATKPDDEWGKIIDVAGFSSNYYLLDMLKNQIWKYVGTSTGYSDRRNYLNEDVKAEFTGATRMQIESSIYVLKQGGEILRFTRGAKDTFALSGLDKGVKDPKSFFVSSETDNLYILDSGNSRLVIVGKAGEYKGQYGGDKFATASDLVVSEKEKKVYLLEESKIYTLDLK